MYRSGRKAARTSQTPCFARSRYVVSPMAGRRVAAAAVPSEPFEATHPLPIRHGGVEGLDFDARLVQVVVDHLVAEGGTGDGGLGEQFRGFAESGRQLCGTRGVSVA